MVTLVQQVVSRIPKAWYHGAVQLLSHFTNGPSFLPSLLKLWYASGLMFLLFILSTVVGPYFQAAVRLMLLCRMSKDFCQATSVCCSGFHRLCPWRHLELLQWGLLAVIQVPPWSLIESAAPSLTCLLSVIWNHGPVAQKSWQKEGARGVNK